MSSNKGICAGDKCMRHSDYSLSLKGEDLFFDGFEVVKVSSDLKSNGWWTGISKNHGVKDL